MNLRLGLKNNMDVNGESGEVILQDCLVVDILEKTTRISLKKVQHV